MVTLTRRKFVELGLAIGLTGASPRSWAKEHIAGDVIVTSYALAQALLALGVTDFGLVYAERYRRNSGDPTEIPASVFDVGSAAEPNLELLWEVRPRLIFHSTDTGLDPRALARIAPVLEFPGVTKADGNILNESIDTLYSIADVLSLEESADRYIDHLTRVFSDGRERLAQSDIGSVLGLDITFGRVFATWGIGSLFDGVLDRLGLTNSVTKRNAANGWLYLSYQELLALNVDWAVHIGPVPPKSTNSPVWQLLPFVREKHVLTLPKENIWQGGLLTAERLARNLTEVLGELR